MDVVVSVHVVVFVVCSMKVEVAGPKSEQVKDPFSSVTTAAPLVIFLVSQSQYREVSQGTMVQPFSKVVSGVLLGLYVDVVSVDGTLVGVAVNDVGCAPLAGLVEDAEVGTDMDPLREVLEGSIDVDVEENELQVVELIVDTVDQSVPELTRLQAGASAGS